MYPVLGYIADVHLSRYRTIMTSVVLLVVSDTMAVVLAGSGSAISTLVFMSRSRWPWYEAIIGILVGACVFIVAVLGV